MAAAATLRKQPVQAVTNARIAYGGYSPLPPSFGKTIAPNLTHGALVLALIIQEESIGKRRPPDTPPPDTNFTRRQAQEWTHLSERGLELAVLELIGGPKPLVSARKHHHWWRFGPIRPDAEIVARPPRHVTRRASEATPEIVTVELPVACPVLTGPCPVAQAQLAAVNGNGEQKSKQTRTPVRVTSVSPSVINKSSYTPSIVVSTKSSPPALRDLQILLYETEFEWAPGVRLSFPRRFGVAVDPEMLGRILDALGTATVEQFSQAVRNSLRRIHSYGFLVLLAGDCAAAPWAPPKPAAPVASGDPRAEMLQGIISTMGFVRDPEWVGHIQRKDFEAQLERYRVEHPDLYAEAEAVYQRAP